MNFRKPYIGLGSLGYGCLLFFTEGISYRYGKSYLPFGEDYVFYGTFFIALGLVALIVYYRGGYNSNDFDVTGEVKACPQCGTSYGIDITTDDHCPSCNVRLEEIEGFYDRHPKHK